MAKVAFFGIPAHGHTNPSLPVVRELVRRGESVTYYSNEEFRDAIESTGARFRAYDPPVGKDFTTESAGSLLLIAMLAETTLEMLPRLVEDLKKDPVDYAIHDSVCPWGRYAAQLLGLPSVCSTTTFALALEVFRPDNFLGRIWNLFKTVVENFPYLARIRRAQNVLERNYGIRSGHFIEFVSNPAPLTIVYTSREVQPRQELSSRPWSALRGRCCPCRHRAGCADRPDHRDRRIRVRKQADHCSRDRSGRAQRRRRVRPVGARSGHRRGRARPDAAGRWLRDGRPAARPVLGSGRAGGRALDQRSGGAR